LPALANKDYIKLNQIITAPLGEQFRTNRNTVSNIINGLVEFSNKPVLPIWQEIKHCKTTLISVITKDPKRVN
jgi:hypothetical protein